MILVIIKVLRFCLVFSVTMGLITTIIHNSIRGYLICSEREEFLRYNLKDFWTPTPYDDSSISNLPKYHPFVIVTYILCKYWIIHFKP